MYIHGISEFPFAESGYGRLCRACRVAGCLHVLGPQAPNREETRATLLTMGGALRKLERENRLLSAFAGGPARASAPAPAPPVPPGLEAGGVLYGR